MANVKLEWDGVAGQDYFVHFADFGKPDAYEVIVGPLRCTATGKMAWQSEHPKPGLYRIGTTMSPPRDDVKHHK